LIKLRGEMMTDNQQKKRHEAWSVKWAPTVPFAILAGFGIQPVLPLINPLLITTICFALGLSVLTVWDAEVGQKRDLQTKIVGIVGFVIAVALVFFCMWELSSAASEIEKPCAAMRARLLAKPNQDDASTYEALHCPVPVQASWIK